MTVKRSQRFPSWIVGAFGVGVLMSLLCPSNLMLIVTLLVLILVAICGCIW